MVSQGYKHRTVTIYEVFKAVFPNGVQSSPLGNRPDKAGKKVGDSTFPIACT